MNSSKQNPLVPVWVTISAIVAMMVGTVLAAPPDLTSGGVPDEDPAITINLGPTGARGWVYHEKIDTSESRQILVTDVEAGSPAAGVLAVDDVILGADGTGANPGNFASDARKSLALAIADAEARSPATLKLLRWRSGSTSTVTLTLQTLGAYSATAPYSCPKSAAILQDGLQYVYDNESDGRYSFGAITLLANGNATYRAKAQTTAHSLIPSQSTMDQMMSDERDASSMITWQRGHTLVFLAEYYLATGDTQVLPAIEAYAVNIAKNRSLFGTVGHIFAEKNADGSANGPMGGVYGVVNSAGMPCFLGVLLAKECGLTNPELDPAIEASSRFFAYYSGKGAIPYGEHEPYIAHESNGKCGLASLYFNMQANRVEEGKFFAKMATASGNERELGHTGSWFNYLWAPLGAAAGGEEAAAAHFSDISWMLDLSRCWDGRFQYDCLNGEGPNSGSSYHDFRMSTAALLTYALPHRQLRITGKGHDAGRYLSSADVTEAVQANDYDADPRSDSQLISDLSNWSPKVRQQAATELGTRSISSAELDQITAMANNTGASSHSRAGACLALGKIKNSSSAAPLAALLTDSDNYVRYSAAEAMRYLSRSANLAVVDTILAAAASTSAPLYPMVEEDPLQFAHGKIGMLLFYSWSAFGPKGVLWDSVDGIDRNLLYPAIEAIAQTPVGVFRGSLERTYDNLTEEDVLALSGTIVDSIVNRAPADKMFSNGVRRGGVAAFRKHSIAEGVPACMAFTADEVGGRRREGLELLGTFGGSVHTVEPDPDVIGFLTSYLSDNETAATAQTALDAINGDTNPVTLVALKSIQSATADASTVNLPANSTTLRVTASDHAEGDSVFTWTKVSGPGSVSFTPNGTSATASTVQFDGTEGIYQFEVTMSDSRGLTEAYDTVTVVLSGGGGGDVTPPVPNPASFSSAPSAPNSSSITMTATAGSDASGTVEYLFTETSGNPGGTSSGWQSSRSYTDGGLNANTQYTYTVTMRDGLGNTGTASAPASATTGGGGGGPASLKVFILAGQSNMEGHGEMNPVGTQGTLDYLVANDPGNYGHLKDGSNWSSRDDVWMWYNRGGSTLLTGDLTAGYGAKSDTIGPELQFGHVMGDVYGEKVLIIKTAWGGKSLAVDYRPPSSGWTVNPPNAAGDEGYYYQEMMSYVNDVLGNLSTYFPEYDAAAGYELAGFGWHQGWNDRVNQEHNDQYEVNLVNLINDVRADLGVPGLPFVIATTGMSGWSETHPRALSLMNAQLAMEDFVKYPAFDGNVAVVETRDFWRDSTVSPSNQNYHWNRNAETYCLIGTAMAQEMQGLIAGGGGGDVSPPTPNPAGFASAPAAGGSTSISMTAITGSDASGPVEYLFTETSGNPGGTSSGWQTSPNYTDSGLNASTQYTYTVRMRDALGNTGSASAGASATTSGGGADTTPPNPNPMTWASVPSAVTSGGDGALIYEPFDMSTGDINGQATGAGLNGNWTRYEGTLEVIGGGLSYGALPTSGNHLSIGSATGRTGASADPGTSLSGAGLLDDGSTLWFSFLIKASNVQSTNDRTMLSLGTDTTNAGSSAMNNSGQGIGVSIDASKRVQATTWSNGSRTAASPSTVVLAPDEVKLVVGQIIWGANGSANDTVNIYLPGTDLVLPGSPWSTGTAVLNQALFDTIAISGKEEHPLMDELRFGASYADVLGQGGGGGGSTSEDTITMAATSATDASGVEYYFTETSGNPGGDDSGWQDSPNYTDTGLQAGTQYTYTVVARDKSANQNATTASVAASATTGGTPPADTAPPTPNPATFASAPAAGGTSSISMTATTGSDPSGVEYLFTETSGNPGGTSSGWQSSPSYTDGGLDPSTQYTYTVTMRDGVGNAGSASSSASATTEAAPDTTPPTPNPASFAAAPSAVSESAISMTATTGSDPSGVEYLFTETSGNPGGTSSGWQSSPNYTDGGLNAATTYSYTVTMRDSLGNTGSASAGASATTQGASGVSLALNGGFESGLTDWNTWNGPTIVSDAHAGISAVLMVDKGSVNQWVTVEPSTEYTLSAYIKTSDATKRVVLGVNDGDNVGIANTSVYDTVYTLHSIVFTTDANTTTVKIYCWQPPSDGASAYVDEMKLVKNGTPPADTDPPTPDPAGFASAPAAGGSTSISMIATTGSDASGPVEYLFTETSGNPGGSNSGWQTNPSYTDTGLSASTQYTYTVTMRDSLGNTGTASAGVSATTQAAPDTDPPTPNPAGFASAPAAGGSTAISMTAITGSDASGPVEYLFTETSGNPGGTSSDWQTSPSYTDAGLDANTQYSYTVTMRDSLGNTGSASVAASATTTGGGGGGSPSILSFTEGSGLGGAGDKTIATNYDASAADKLVVVLGGEHGFSGNTNGHFYSVTYGGVALTEAVQEESGVPTAAIFYLDSPGAAGDLVVNQDNHNNSLYAIYQLSGTEAGIGNSSQSTTDAVNLTTTGSNSLVIAGILDAGPAGGNGAPNLTANAPLTEDTVTDLIGGSRWVSMSTGSAVVASAGSATYSFANAGGTDLLALVAVEFRGGGGPSTVTVPNVVGQSQATAESNLTGAGLTIGTVTTASSGSVPAGDVISHNPSGGSSVASGSSVDLVVSSGPAMVTVPGVEGLSQAAAESAIAAASLTLGTVTTEFSATVSAGDVISQGLSPGASVPINSAVDLVVSLGVDNSPKLVRTTVSNVSNTSWTTVNLGQTYNSPVIIATPIYTDASAPSVVTRITNVTSTGFDLKLDRADTLTDPVTIDVSVIAVDEGVYTVASDGVKMEAVKYTSTVTAAKSGWTSEARSYQNSYSAPVVVGQVMSANDPDWSVFWSMGATRFDPADAANLGVGKHVAEDPDKTRADETIGYIVIEQGSGSINGVAYEAALGADTVLGPANSVTPYTYSLSGGLSSASAAAVSVSAMDGNNGGWGVLAGSPALTPSSIGLYLIECQMADSERWHTDTQMSYLIFE